MALAPSTGQAGILMAVAVSEMFDGWSNADVPLWYVWPDALPAILFITAFALICRDIWEFQTHTVRLPAILLPRRQRDIAQ